MRAAGVATEISSERRACRDLEDRLPFGTFSLVRFWEREAIDEIRQRTGIEERDGY